jgi:superfamily II RNA helicase
MVKICPDTYDNNDYSQHFDKYPFPLSSFQKYAIEAIVEGNHILVTAHTGSGKTLPAEFAIDFFTNKKKKVIYTSPIKALSNQKFYEFKQKFPDISFGILTGDIKTNPEADVLIMTTEILMNTLYAKQQTNKFTNDNNTNTSLTMFEMDFKTELACVIFDEIHYINDADRGRVWEETIMMLPPHIQMVMLSATLDSPEKFASWCETRGTNCETRGTNCETRGTNCETRGTNNTNNENNKIVYLASTYERVVPLTHYSFITCTQGLFKVLKDKQLEMEIMRTTNTLHVIQDSKGRFNELNYQRIDKTLKIFKDKNHFVKRQHILNTVARHMVDHNMLPAICFVLSRKALEQCAKEITIPLLEDDSKVPYIIHKECEQIIRKLPNYEEYLQLPEYVSMVSLLEKGIAIHHAGVMPILREMVELLFAKGYIKLLFATETFAVGINMPTKTVIFTDINKFDGSGMRPLYSHEYTQMAGRAGRRGIDTVGHVIHLSNLFKNMDQLTIKTMMKGTPQRLMSKFKVSYNLLLNLINIGETDYTRYAKRSMIQGDIEMVTKNYSNDIGKIREELDKLTMVIKYPLEVVEEYSNLKEARKSSVNKKRKEIDRKIELLKDNYKNIEDDSILLSKYSNKRLELTNMESQLVETEKTLDTNVQKVMNLLEQDKFIYMKTEDQYHLTMKGYIASQIRETNCLVFAALIEDKVLHRFNSKELVGILSCFTNVSVPEDKRALFPASNYIKVKECIEQIYNMYQKQSDSENKYRIETGIDYNMHFDLIEYCMEWCECETEIDCKLLLQKITDEKQIFLGEFVKSVLKINNITSEMEKIAEVMGDMDLLVVLREVPHLTLKYVATNQSLYV